MVYLEPFEHELHPVVAAMGRKIGMGNFPDPEAIRDGLETTFNKIPFLDTPSEQLNTAIAGTKFGVTNQIDFVERRDGISHADAKRKVMRIARETAAINEFRASRRSPADPTEGDGAGDLDDEQQEIRPELAGEGAAEATGRRGGRAQTA